MYDFWGYHLILDIKQCDLEIVTKPENIKLFSNKLVEHLEMVPYGGPLIVHFCEHVDDKKGWTLVQLIETSNIMCHFCDNTGDAYLDIFSCKKFSINNTINFIKNELSPTSIKLRGLVFRDVNR